MRLMTIGGYGFNESTFIAALRRDRVDTFVDIRRRRGVRGHEYAFLNSRRLQALLASAKIHYVYMPQFAPTESIRQIQKKCDAVQKVAQRRRTLLSSDFRTAFTSQILREADVSEFESAIGTDSQVVALFCVESVPEACHRLLVAEWLSKELGITVTHIRP